VVNQINSQHPLAPERLADALEIPLIAALPPDPRAIGYQVNFGEPCVAQHGSHFGRGIMRLAQRLRQDAARLTSAQADAPALAGSSLVGRQGRSNVRE
jgi:septum formation inhibitor-activating ATPase MinD